MTLVRFLGLLGWGLAPLTAAFSQTVGDRVDLTAFGSPLAAPDRGVEWTGPMRVDEVRLTAGADAKARDWRVEWWGSVWPDNGTGGWMRLDDPWNGQWVRVPALPEPQGEGTWRFTMPPLTKQEWSRAVEPDRSPEGKVPTYRKTLKARILDGQGNPIPDSVRVEMFSEARWAEAAFDLHHRQSLDGPVRFRLEVTHGRLVSLEPLSPGAEIKGDRWSSSGIAGTTTGVRARILHVDSPDLNGEERTRLTVRTGWDEEATGFSFVPQDVPQTEAIRLPDFGFLIARSPLGRHWQNNPGPGPGAWSKRVRFRLTERPETTRQSAMAGLPRLSPARDVPLGVPSARQEFFVSPTGEWIINALSLNTDNGRDAQRWVFTQSFGNERQRGELRAALDTRDEPRFDGADRTSVKRFLEENHLPLIHVDWRTGPIAYHHELATTILQGDYGDDTSRRGDETVVLLTRLSLTNTSAQPQVATVNLRYNLDWPLHLASDGTVTVDWPAHRARPEGTTAVRLQVQEAPPPAGQPGSWQLVPSDKPNLSSRLRWETRVQPGEGRVLYFKAPFVDALEAQELKALRAMQFEDAVPRMLDWWKNRLAARAQLTVPDPMLNSFYQANLWHLLITTDRDPETGLFNQGVGTVNYRVFANETVMIARYLDLVGEHREAERFLEPLIHYQGTEALTGNFSTKEGVFHGAGQYTHGQYAMNHGFVLWGVADHYLVTRDRAYLDRVAPALVRGCDFLIRERRATWTPSGQHRLPYHGLAPASSLEDVVEFQYWFAVNSYFYLGLKRAAEALRDIGHPEASRMLREAEAYRQDIEQAAREATTRAAVVRLRDHAWIPYVPSRVHQWRHLTEGWIREALYPALHLATAEVVSCHDPLITWMLDDLEDNIFFSWQSGYNVTDYEQTWFEHGGVTLQPCLLDMVPTYLARDEIPAALRTFWNTYALSIYPDVHCFAEWAKGFGQGGGPVYKTSDEARFLIWLRQLLLWENGDQLWYGRGLPRAWLAPGQEVKLDNACTRLGKTSFALHSEAAENRVVCRIVLPDRQLPANAWLRLRHPQEKRPVNVKVDLEPVPSAQIHGEDIRLDLTGRTPGDTLSIVAFYEE